MHLDVLAGLVVLLLLGLCALWLLQLVPCAAQRSWKKRQPQRPRGSAHAVAVGGMDAAAMRAMDTAMDGCDAETKAVIAGLMVKAKERLQAGDGQAATQYAIAAVQLSTGGDDSAIRKCLDRAKGNADRARHRERALHPHLSEADAAELAAARMVRNDMLQRESLVAEQGRAELLQDAFDDGSSVVCTRCGDLVSLRRWDAHKARWCRMNTQPQEPGAAPKDDDDDST
ncbi:hypothetical protein M885DRAFT_622112 [Pelagophyceae sp. CCMP2097]|nr:hypothetical protein M885DRAFT_622112 [Pelagophyceae sp. CCMP2097]